MSNSFSGCARDIDGERISQQLLSLQISKVHHPHDTRLSSLIPSPTLFTIFASFNVFIVIGWLGLILPLSIASWIVSKLTGSILNRRLHYYFKSFPEIYDELSPILGNRMWIGVCPPSKYAFPPPDRELWPFCPRPDVFPFLFPGPRPTRAELTTEPGSGASCVRIEALLIEVARMQCCRLAIRHIVKTWGSIVDDDWCQEDFGNWLVRNVTWDRELLQAADAGSVVGSEFRTEKSKFRKLQPRVTQRIESIKSDALSC